MSKTVQPMWSRRKFLRASALLAGASLAPGLLPSAVRAASSARVVVVGGGLAGLATAYNLATRYRIPCTVYEARDRLGGRVSTIRSFAGGQWAERGGQFLSSGDRRLRKLVRDLRLSLIDLDASYPSGPRVLRFGGNVISESSLKADLATVAEVAYGQGRGLVRAATWDRINPATSAWDAVSVEEWLDDACPGGIASTIAQYLKVYFETEYGGPIADASALHMIYDFNLPDRGYDERYTIDGGNDLVASAIEGVLPPGTFVMESALTSIGDLTGGGYGLVFSTASGSLAVEADIVVLALPFTTLRDVDTSGLALDARHRDAIDTLGMGVGRKLNLQFASPAWEPAGSGDSTSDLATGVTWPTQVGLPGAQGLLTAFPSSDSSALYAGEPAHGAASAPVVAAHLSALDQIFPGTSASFTGAAELDNWPADPWVKGSYSYYKTGQFTAFAGIEGTSEGNLFFAGEHTARYKARGTMNGAVESGELAARLVRRAVRGLAHFPLAP